MNYKQLFLTISDIYIFMVKSGINLAKKGEYSSFKIIREIVMAQFLIIIAIVSNF